MRNHLFYIYSVIVNSIFEKYMETPGGDLHFTPLTGEGFTEAFWMLSGQLTDDDFSFELEDTRSGQAALTRVLGELMYLCIFAYHSGVASIASCRALYIGWKTGDVSREFGKKT